MSDKLIEIASEFVIEGRIKSVTPLGCGHINETYLVKTVEENTIDYVLQKINNKIFKNIDHLTNNIQKVTGHIAEKIELNKTGKILTQKLELIQTKNNLFYFVDNEEGYWRMYNFIKDSYCYEIIDNQHKAKKAGLAFGKFQSLLADLPFNELFEIIPDFHNIKTRYYTFIQTIEKNPINRISEAKNEIEFVNSTIEELIVMQQLIDDGQIPLRITHNDTKINNILFDKNDNPVCIVDLDIVMPGSVLYDFGDAIRTATNTAAEDEADLSKISMNIELFKAYFEGYYESTKDFLTENEINNLALSAKYITFIMGLRFLTDFIDGDNYYKIHSEKHNLQRAKAQFTLFKSINNQYDAMQKIINEFINK